MLTGVGVGLSGWIGASADQEHVTNQQAAYAQEIAATFEELSRTAEQISAVSWLAIVMNTWNRIAVRSHTPVDP